MHLRVQMLPQHLPKSVHHRLQLAEPQLALAGQGTHALSGLVLQVVAARELGPVGLATFSLVYGALTAFVLAVYAGLIGLTETVVGRSGGVTRLRWGAYEARVNSMTGNVITVVRIGSGGGGR